MLCSEDDSDDESEEEDQDQRLRKDMLEGRKYVVDMARSLIENGAEVDKQNKYGSTALLIACHCDSWDLVRLLIDSGADINLKEKETNHTVLLHVCLKAGGKHAKYCLQLVRLLIEKHADVNVTDTNLRTPLMYASQGDTPENVELVQLLIEKGANVRAQDASGSTALMHALDNGAVRVSQLLKKYLS